jgi:predicted DNA-binding transcriptional regulator YafY
LSKPPSQRPRPCAFSPSPTPVTIALLADLDEQPDGSILVTYSAPDLIWASTTALTYGPLVVIEEPAELAELHRAQAREILENYER